MIQEILVGTIFIGALAFLTRMIYRQLQAKTACASACGKCNVVDFNKIEADLRGKGL
jgi:bacterioferritin-associated ferredoxin